MDVIKLFFTKDFWVNNIKDPFTHMAIGEISAFISCAIMILCKTPNWLMVVLGLSIALIIGIIIELVQIPFYKKEWNTYTIADSIRDVIFDMVGATLIVIIFII